MKETESSLAKLTRTLSAKSIRAWKHNHVCNLTLKAFELGASFFLPLLLFMANPHSAALTSFFDWWMQPLIYDDCTFLRHIKAKLLRCPSPAQWKQSVPRDFYFPPVAGGERLAKSDICISHAVISFSFWPLARHFLMQSEILWIALRAPAITITLDLLELLR
jgi:hypothetical protein